MIQEKDKANEGVRIIAVCRAGGGTGATFVTVNLAASLVKKQISTAVMDADLQFGDVALTLDMQPAFTLKEYAEERDGGHLQKYCTRHPSGILLLAAPQRPEYADLVTTSILDRAILDLKSKARVVLIDTPVGLNDKSLAIAEKADDILVVGTPGMAILKNTRLFIETLEALGMKEKVKLVINKSSLASLIALKEFPQLCKMDKAFFLPYEEKFAIPSFDKGIPIVESHPKLDFSKRIEKLTGELFSEENKTGKKPAKKKWLNRLSSYA